MKKALFVSLLSLVTLLSVSAHAQVLCALGTPATPYDSMADMPATGSPQADVKKLKAMLCPKGACSKLFLFANPTTPNMATVTDGAGVSKIAYSPGFVKSVQTSYGPVATLGIFAHDVGHHLEATGNRPAWMQSSWDSELRADAWAGCAMAKAELRPSGLQAVLLVLSEYPSAKHPAWNVRRPVITEGYKACGGRMLPPLAKEAAEHAATASAGKDDGATPAAGPGGCSGDKDCRRGRMCVNSRCTAAPERRRCGKDTDCPDPQECSAAGVCESPASQAGAESEPAKAAPPMLASASLQTQQRPAAPADAPAASAGNAAGCLKTCDDVRTLCVDAATSEGNKCLLTIQSDPSYRACSCASYPNVSSECYAFCGSASERGKGCGVASLVRDCRSDGDRCRSRCQ